MYCKYCGQQIDDNSQFCKFCGKRLVDSQRIVVELKKPNFDKINLNSRDIYSHFLTFCKRSKKVFIAFFTFLLSTFAASMFPFSAFLVLRDFFDISSGILFIMDLVCSMLFGGYVTYQVMKDSKSSSL